MTTNHKELCERLISDIGKAILGEGTESLALVLSRCAALLQSQAARIQQQEERIAELDRKHKEAWDDCGELNTANHELIAACVEKDGRIAELEKERDALKVDAEGYRLIRAGRVYVEPQDIDGRVYVATSERGRYCKTADAFDAEIAAALQAEKETRS